MRFRQLLPLFGVLFVLYIIWGSTYLVIRIGVKSWPPLIMAGVRFLAAGILLLAFSLLHGHRLPPLCPLFNAALIGLLLLIIGDGVVTVAEHQDAPSDVAAVVVVTVPLFTLYFSRLFSTKMRKLGWVGIAIGLAGVIILNGSGNPSGNPQGAILILTGSISWAFDPVYGSHITLLVGIMTGTIEMSAVGVVLMIASMIAGEKLTALPSLSGFPAVGYLALFGSIIAINAYIYLIRSVSPALVISYAYVNPVVTVLLGTGLGGETLSEIEWLVLGVIVPMVVLVTPGKYLFLAKPAVVSVIQDVSSKQMNPLRVDLRAGIFVADPPFRTLAKHLIRQPLAPT